MENNKIKITGHDYTELTKAIITGKGINDEETKKIAKDFLENYSMQIKQKKNNTKNKNQKAENKIPIDKIPIVSFSEDRKDGEKLSDAILYTPAQKAIDKEDWFGNLVGIIRDRNYRYVPEKSGSGTHDEKESYYDIELQIHSRMDGKKPYFLAHMLESAIPGLKFNNSQVPSNMNELFEFMLIYWFKNQLLEAYILGPFRTYQRFEKNDDRIRGSIDIARHIRLNAGMCNGKIAYSYKENTTDNYFNHLLVHSYLELKKTFPERVSAVIDNDPEIKSIVSELMFRAPSYKDYAVRTVMQKNDRCISQPYYLPYEKLRETCLRILRHLGLSIFEEKDNTEDVEGILFYVPDLWECFVKAECIPKIKPDDVQVGSQEKIKYLSIDEFEKINDLSKEKKKELDNCFKNIARPDFVFYDKKKNPFMILDAKYRPNWDKVMSEGRLNLNNLDFKADYDKCIRDMNLINGHGTGVIFPVQTKKGEDNKDKDSNGENGEVKVNLVHQISAYNLIDRFYTIPIFIPKSKPEEKYDVWKKGLDEEQKNKDVVALLTVQIIKRKELQEKIVGLYDQIDFSSY